MLLWDTWLSNIEFKNHLLLRTATKKKSKTLLFRSTTYRLEWDWLHRLRYRSHRSGRFTRTVWLRWSLYSSIIMRFSLMGLRRFRTTGRVQINEWFSCSCQLIFRRSRRVFGTVSSKKNNCFRLTLIALLFTRTQVNLVKAWSVLQSQLNTHPNTQKSRTGLKLPQTWK